MKSIVIYFLKKYKSLVSPIFETLLGNACRFTPTCSEYTIEAVEKKGIVQGLILGLIRILKCNPLSTPGYDPLV